MPDIDPRAVEAVMGVARRDGFLGDDPDDWRDIREQVVRELEAAAPYLYAQALREAADSFHWFNSEPITTIHPDRADAGVKACQDALRRRADELDPPSN